MGSTTSDEARVRLRPVCLVAAGLVVLLGIWMLLRQDLYISTEPSGPLEQSVNWWGIGIGAGLVVGGAGGFKGALTRHRIVLLASGMLICVSGMWHPLLWPALLAAAPLFVFATTRTTASVPSLSQST